MTSSPTPADAGPSRPALPPSPCVGICALKADHCYGCGRTSDEIAAWGTLTPAAQSAVLAELPSRLAAFGFKTFRLAAGPAVVGDFIGRTFRETTGRWRLVSASIEGTLAITDADRPVINETAARVHATAANGDTLTLAKHDRVRVFGFASSAGTTQMDTIALVLPKGRAQRDLKEAIVDTGTEIRTELPLVEPFAEAWLLDDASGTVYPDPSWITDSTARSQLSANGGTRIGLRNALGTIETSAIAYTDGAAPDANAPSDVKISRAFIACAIFHADDPVWLAAALAP